jgi:hypothetical protein
MCSGQYYIKCVKAGIKLKKIHKCDKAGIKVKKVDKEKLLFKWIIP